MLYFLSAVVPDLKKNPCARNKRRCQEHCYVRRTQLLDVVSSPTSRPSSTATSRVMSMIRSSFA